jgi:hypothetical protein
MFDQYLDGKTPDNYKINPWFQEFYDSMFQCTWTTPGSCDRTRGIPRAENYVQVNIMKKLQKCLYVSANGLRQGLKLSCLHHHYYVCWRCYVVSVELLYLSACLSFFVCYQIYHKLDPHISIAFCRHLEHCQVRLEFALQYYWTWASH